MPGWDRRLGSVTARAGKWRIARCPRPRPGKVSPGSRGLRSPRAQPCCLIPDPAGCDNPGACCPPSCCLPRAAGPASGWPRVRLGRWANGSGGLGASTARRVLLAAVEERGHSGGRNELFLVLQVIRQGCSELLISVFGQSFPGFSAP